MHFITAVYRFFDVARPEELREELLASAERHDIQGLAIVAHEGLNGTFAAADASALEAFREDLRRLSNDPNLEFKDSESEIAPFAFFDVKVRPEIVSLGRPDLRPELNDPSHLTPDEWDRALLENDGIFLWDLRNDYEYRVGTFPGAENPVTRIFSEWPERLRESGPPKDKKILIFCTGGIRCEKGALELRSQGYQQVFQLRGGILNYLKEKPQGLFEGECVVFDQRVAVDANLKPTRNYVWCPHCGNPAAQVISCRHCRTKAKVCDTCYSTGDSHRTCSKNCRNHHRLQQAK